MTLFDILNLSMYQKVPFDVEKHLKRIPVCLCVMCTCVCVVASLGCTLETHIAL